MDHEVLDHPMELGALVALHSPRPSVGQRGEVPDGLGHDLAEEADLDAAEALVADGDVEPGLGCDLRLKIHN